MTQLAAGSTGVRKQTCEKKIIEFCVLYFGNSPFVYSLEIIPNIEPYFHGNGNSGFFVILC